MAGRRHDWCILRTSGARTLALAASLMDEGIEAWTPVRTFMRLKPGSRRGEAKIKVEASAPILPTFVFARAHHLAGLAHASRDPAGPHPAFSIFHHDGRVPLIGDASIAGLRAEEAAATAALRAERDADTREEQRRERAAMLRTERERRKAMRAERRDFAPGTHVVVAGAPALAGMVGAVSKSKGRSAVVAFGGSLVMEIEAWQLSPYEVQSANIAA